MRCFLSFKAYGDLVIACHHLRENSSAGEVLVCADHLRPLLRALAYPGPTVFLDGGESGVPALFDIRKQGVVAAARSAVSLRHAIGAVTQPGDMLVFDRIGWRQRYLAAGRASVDVISGRPNIYLDYEAFLGTCAAHPVNLSALASVGKIGIFPDSRVAAKQIPDSLVRKIADALHLAGHEVRIVRAGPGGEVDTFEALVERIGSFAAIVSADSLPAHIAEYIGRPMFIFSPVANTYWLPKTALAQESHALFRDSLDRLHSWVKSNQLV
jgi:hypothetical protein